MLAAAYFGVEGPHAVQLLEVLLCADAVGGFGYGLDQLVAGLLVRVLVLGVAVQVVPELPARRRERCAERSG